MNLPAVPGVYLYKDAAGRVLYVGKAKSLAHRVRRYLAPFTDVKMLRRTLGEIRRIFPVRTCRNFEDYRRADRPCLYFHIGRCVGPCTTRSRATPQEYRALVDQLILFLTGRNDELLVRLREEMQRASAERRFEAAAQRRGQLLLLEKGRMPQSVGRR